ncbi:purine-nucleoside phosphorylase [candidate division BRC1 bacterium HGW-BRC1-1]|nr:MAG: purine-nucleoside phosphorylase [candidate division BRC1 bacterium HGW-BRC1-1]
MTSFDATADDPTEALAETLKERLAGQETPRLLVVAGSGLGGFARSVDARLTIPYSELPGVGSSTVAGHSGTLVCGRTGNTPLLLMNGRRHLYEGMPAARNTALLRAILLATGVPVVVLSNAAGGLNPTFEVGDLMLISDHINMTFRNPLIGPNRDDWGPRFPDASALYSPRLRVLAREAALKAGVPVREGVYLAGLGPSYETRAEVSMLRTVMGADAVGMSTAPETLAATHMGREVLGISFISNLLTVPAKTTHDEVMENSRRVEEKFTKLVTAFIAELG